VKFKTIFILFNAIILFSFLFVFLMPLIVLGGEYGNLFLKSNWYIAIIFVAAMGALNAYFISNWKMFHYLERENWQGLQGYLDEKLNKKGQISSRQVRIYLNTALVLSQVDKITHIREILKENAPRQYRRFALELGIPFLVEGQFLEGYNYYSQTPDKSGNLPWISWAKAFCLLNLRRMDEGRELLLKLLEQGRNKPLQLMAAYLLSSLGTEDEATNKVLQDTRTSLKENSSPKELTGKMNRQKESNLLLLLFGKVYSEALDWCFVEGLPGSPEGVTQ